ncbi:piggyBac transposable element-derived protein 4-like [Hydra vulgaris]|uniref:PiggyBac transposable element-derived protein 4-like n=1 Tax=Hydra vulgaris TaxID=6087 RepID=A0ABM4CL98_HYDVU
MEELSIAEFESNNSDGEDGDWVPNIMLEHEVSDNDDNVYISDKENEEEVEASQGKNSDNERNDKKAVEAQEAEPQSTYIAKGIVWNKIPSQQNKTPFRNIVRQRSGPSKSTETLSISDIFLKIFTVEMADIVTRHTNKKAFSVYSSLNLNSDSKREWKPVTVQEIYSFMAILICSGVNNSNTDHVSDVWHSSSYPLYRTTMGINRFRNVMRFIRFDDANTRMQRKITDEAAPIRDIWTMLNKNLSQIYKPTENLTVDEQLYPFRGRTKFTQYIPSKPAKYGIKIWWVCDAENAFPLNGIIYTGKTGHIREKNQELLKNSQLRTKATASSLTWVQINQENYTHLNLPSMKT